MRVCPKCWSIYRVYQTHCGVDGSELIEQDEDPLVGRTVDRYEIDIVLGEGGMAGVYRAKHTNLGTMHALKVLRGELASNKQVVARFNREARSVARMRHRNIVSVTDFGTTPTGLTFLVMELVDGRTLDAELREVQALPPRRAAEISRQVAAGLAEAHQQGFVHRDLKPSNVMLGSEDGEEVVKILDFGLVGLVDEQQQVNDRLTQAGYVMGTPAYMSPEQGLQLEVGPTSDLYSLGIMIYEMLTGTVPFNADSVTGILLAHVRSPIPRLPPSGGLEELVYALLAKEQQQRPENAVAVIERLDRVLAKMTGSHSVAGLNRSSVRGIREVNAPTVGPRKASRPEVAPPAQEAKGGKLSPSSGVRKATPSPLTPLKTTPPPKAVPTPKPFAPSLQKTPAKPMPRARSRPPRKKIEIDESVRLGDLLLTMGFVGDDELRSLEEKRARTGRGLVRLMVEGGIITEERLLLSLSQQLDMPVCEVGVVPHSVRATIPLELARAHHAIPVQLDGSTLMVAIADPLDWQGRSKIQAATSHKVEWRLASELAIDNANQR